jgi:hypothetical protein
LKAFDLRPLSLGEVLDRAFLMYRESFLLFVGISAVPQMLSLSVYLIDIFFSPLISVTSRTGHRTVALSHTSSTGLLLAVIGVVVGFFVLVLLSGGTVFAVADIYLGRKATITRSLIRSWRRLGTLLATEILGMIAFLLGLITFVIPGVYVSCRLAVSLPAAVIENRTARDSLSRSWSLTKGYTGRFFVILLLYLLLRWGLGYLFGHPISLTLEASQRSGGDVRFWLAVRQVANALVSILVFPWSVIAITICYFDLRIRKEGFDLQFMMDPTSERTTREPPNSDILSLFS